MGERVADNLPPSNLFSSLHTVVVPSFCQQKDKFFLKKNDQKSKKKKKKKKNSPFVSCMIYGYASFDLFRSAL